jgi:molybdopterin converting factor small subunit
MVEVRAAGGDCERFTGGLARFEVEAATVGGLIAELEDHFPGLGRHIERRMAVVIDGEIHQDAHGASLVGASEVWLIPRIGGG